MPIFTKLSDEESYRYKNRSTKEKGNKRQETRQRYSEFLEKHQPGDKAAWKMSEGENKVTVKNRLKAAADELGWKLKFERTRVDVVFTIQSKHG